MSLFGNIDETWVKATDDGWVTGSSTVLILRADGTYTKQFGANVGNKAVFFPVGFQTAGVHHGTWTRDGHHVHLSGDGNWPPYTENLKLFRKVSSVASSSPAARKSPDTGMPPPKSPGAGMPSSKWELFTQTIDVLQNALDKPVALEEPVLR